MTFLMILLVLFSVMILIGSIAAYSGSVTTLG
jgi:hypothetical protein